MSKNGPPRKSGMCQRKKWDVSLAPRTIPPNEQLSSWSAASACGALNELLVSQRTAMLTPPEDVKGLVASVCHLLDAPKEAMEMAQRAAAIARAQYLWPDRIGGYCAIYDRLSGAPDAPVD